VGGGMMPPTVTTSCGRLLLASLELKIV
jgi:hypothetical protein